MSMQAVNTAEPGSEATTTSGARRLVGVVVTATATLAGCLAAAAALGLALPRGADTVPGSLLTGLGLVSAALLLAAACWMLLRATRGWARLVLLPWLIVVSLAVYSVSIALAAVYPPRTAAGEVPRGAVPVRMTSADGTRLAGWYLPSRNGAAIVLRHGAGSGAADTIAQARALHEAGYGVLATDARGHGSSGGRAMDLGWYGEVDILAAVDLLSDRADIDAARIAVVGLSMGGEEAIGAAAVDERICAVVAEGATGRTKADKTWLAEEYGAAGVIQGWLDAVTYGLIALLAEPDPPAALSDSIRTARGTPFFLIAAGDVRDEQLVAERLRQIDPDRVSTWTAREAGHSRAMQSSPQEWSRRVVRFLEGAFDDCAQPARP